MQQSDLGFRPIQYEQNNMNNSSSKHENSNKKNQNQPKVNRLEFSRSRSRDRIKKQFHKMDIPEDNNSSWVLSGEKQKSYNGRWSEKEHTIFLELYEQYPKDWKKISQILRIRSPSQVRSHAQKFFQKMQRRKDHHGELQFTQQNKMRLRTRLNRVNFNNELYEKSHKIQNIHKKTQTQKLSIPQKNTKKQVQKYEKLRVDLSNQNWEQNAPILQNRIIQRQQIPQITQHSEILQRFFVINKSNDSLLLIPKEKYREFLQNIRKYGPTKQNIQQFGQHFLPIDISKYNPRQTMFIDHIIQKLVQKNLSISSETTELLFLENIFNLLLSESEQMLQQINIQIKRYSYTLDSIKFLKKAKLTCFKQCRRDDQQSIT